MGHLVRLALVGVILAGCSGSKPVPPVAHKPAPVDPWVLTCVDPTIDTPALLWNGQIGVRIGRDGTGVGPMFSITEYENKGEEKIKPIANILSARWTAGTTPISPAESTDYSQSLDMRTGVLATNWSQNVDGVKLRVSVESVMSPTEATLAQRWKFESDSYIEIYMRSKLAEWVSKGQKSTDFLLEWVRQGSPFAIHEADRISPDIRREDPTANPIAAWTATSAELLVSNAADRGKPLTVERTLQYVPVGTVLSLIPGVTLYEQVASVAEAEWKKRWNTDIEIDGPVEDQQAVRSFLFYLRSAIDPKGKMAISPFGLSSETYGGHVFWDADIWVFPALAFIDPDAAKAIPNYRLAMGKQASANFARWIYQLGRPTATGQLGSVVSGGLILFGTKFPWESSVSGKETVPGPSRFEDHINGDVPWMMHQAGALGLVSETQSKSAVLSGSGFFSQRVARGSIGEWQIRDTMSPDENHVGDNDLFTNLLAQWCLNGGKWTHPAGGAPALRLPKDKTSFLTYDNDPIKGYKQAAAVLSIYPLQYPPAEAQAKVMMDRFADKVSKNGPAMSDSLHALIWARLGDTDKAYDTWRKSWMDFVKEPHLQFSEKRNKASTYFTTGAAGCLQTVLYGFLGFRIDSKKQDGASWSTPLALGQILSVKPNLPKSWKSVKLKNFTVLGRRYTLIASRPDQSGTGGVQVIQGVR